MGRVGNRYVGQGGQTENQGGQTKHFFRAEFYQTNDCPPWPETLPAPLLWTIVSEFRPEYTLTEEQLVDNLQSSNLFGCALSINQCKYSLPWLQGLVGMQVWMTPLNRLTPKTIRRKISPHYNLSNTTREQENHIQFRGSKMQRGPDGRRAERDPIRGVWIQQQDSPATIITSTSTTWIRLSTTGLPHPNEHTGTRTRSRRRR